MNVPILFLAALLLLFVPSVCVRARPLFPPLSSSAASSPGDSAGLKKFCVTKTVCFASESRTGRRTCNVPRRLRSSQASLVMGTEVAAAVAAAVAAVVTM